MLALFLIYFAFIVPFSSLEREDAEDLIKRHGGRCTGSVSKKTVIILIMTTFDIASLLVVSDMVLAELSSM